VHPHFQSRRASQIDTFDMKPDAPREIRGPFQPIRTNNPDLQISEIFPHIAKGRGQVFARAQRLSHRCGSARHGTSDDADWAAFHGRHQHAARRLRARVFEIAPQ
jgi:hypothetical protein